MQKPRKFTREFSGLFLNLNLNLNLNLFLNLTIRIPHNIQRAIPYIAVHPAEIFTYNTQGYELYTPNKENTDHQRCPSRLIVFEDKPGIQRIQRYDKCYSRGDKTKKRDYF